MRRKLPNQFRPIALLGGALLSCVVMISDSPVAVGASLIVLAMALIAFEGPALIKNVEDDSE